MNLPFLVFHFLFTRVLRTLGFLLMFFLLAACASGSAYRGPPELSLGQGEAVAGDINLRAWWRQLGDEGLAGIVDETLTGNLDIAGALSRLEASQALLRGSGARNWPQLDASAGVTAQRQSLNGPMPVLKDRDQTIYNAGLSASWELDLFGRVRHGVDAASAQAGVAVADLAGVRLMVASEAARLYLTTRAAQQELQARQRQVAVLGELAALMARRQAAGEVPEEAGLAAQARVLSARLAIPGLEGRIHNGFVALAALQGRLPEAFSALEVAPAPADLLSRWPTLPVGQRADIVLARPDIRASERRLAARVSQEELARAERFPKLLIGASGGFQSLEAGTLLGGNSAALSLTPLIQWRVFDGGRVSAEIAAAKAQSSAAATDYRNTVLQAIADCERALGDYRRAREQWQLQADLLVLIQQRQDFIERQFQRGQVGRADFLEAQRAMAEAEEGQARLAANLASALTTAIKALGGGWQLTGDRREAEAVGSWLAGRR